MQLTLIFLALVAFAAADERSLARAPATVTIAQFPFVASMLRNSGNNNFAHQCAGSILNNRSVLTAARCVAGDAAGAWRFRLGSANMNSGGTIYAGTALVVHDFDEWSMMNDIAILRTNAAISFNNNVRAANIAGVNYYVNDYQPVAAIGWGYLGMPGWVPSQYTALRRFQSWAVNTNTCRNYYGSQGVYIQYSMLCSGFPYQATFEARDKCFGEPGGPLLHGNNVVVGVRSWALSCNNANAPAVNTRVSSYAVWIDNNS